MRSPCWHGPRGLRCRRGFFHLTAALRSCAHSAATLLGSQETGTAWSVCTLILLHSWTCLRRSEKPLVTCWMQPAALFEFPLPVDDLRPGWPLTPDVALHNIVDGCDVLKTLKTGAQQQLATTLFTPERFRVTESSSSSETAASPLIQWISQEPQESVSLISTKISLVWFLTHRHSS